MKTLQTICKESQVTKTAKNIVIKYESFAERKLKEIHKDLKKRNMTSMAILTSGIVLSALFIFVLILTKFVFFAFLGFVSFIFALVLYEFLSFPYNKINQAKTLYSGILGEASFAKMLKETVPPYHAIIYNYATPRGDIDAIVVGRSGVYVFEVKNVCGFLTFEDNRWIRHKTGLLGRSYGVEAGNYMLQAKRNADYVKMLLGFRGIYVPVDYYVVFTHQGLKIDSKFKTEKMLHLQEFKSSFKWNKDALSDNLVEQILRVLDLAARRENQNNC